MKDKYLSIGIIISVSIHLILLGVIGGTSAAKPIDLEHLKLVKVDLVKAPDDPEIIKNQQDEPKPEPKAEAPKFSPPPAVVPPVRSMHIEPKVKPVAAPVKSRPVVYNQNSRPVRVASSKLPGNPGGELNLGSSSSHGSLSVNQGQTSVGFVPSTSPGKGEGSGTGAGKAVRQDPVKDASSGPGTEPAPAYVPPPPPPPKMVEVKVCSSSGMRPGRHCDKTTTREFMENGAPSDTCTRCKEPEPVHNSRLAESRPAELIEASDRNVRIPGIVKEAGVKAVVKVTYTVNTDGSVSDMEVVQSSGNPLLDKAVVDAWSKLKYSPAIQDGIARSSKKRRTFTYNGN